MAMEALEPGRGNFYNLGIGHGYSVRQVIESVKRVTGRDTRVTEGSRRPGDPPMLYANSDRAQTELGWRPKVTDLDEIVRTAWAWHEARPDGYDD
jgi:UDP-glucose 4-epimerase